MHQNRNCAMKIGNFCLNDETFLTEKLVSQLKNKKVNLTKTIKKSSELLMLPNLFLFSREHHSTGTCFFTKRKQFAAAYLRNSKTFCSFGPICLKHKTAISKNTSNNDNHGEYVAVFSSNGIQFCN